MSLRGKLERNEKIEIVNVKGMYATTQNQQITLSDRISQITKYQTLQLFLYRNNANSNLECKNIMQLKISLNNISKNDKILILIKKNI